MTVVYQHQHAVVDDGVFDAERSYLPMFVLVPGTLAMMDGWLKEWVN